jgi:hypothetical protein
MKKIHFNHGMTFEFGLIQPYFQGGFGFQYNRAKTHAKLVDQYGVEWQEDLMLRAFSFPLELGIALGEDGATIIPGIGFNFMLWRYFTRVGEPDKIDDLDYYKSNTDVGMHAKLYVKFVLGGIDDSGLGIIIEPYFNLGVLGCDMGDMNETLNPYTYSSDPEKKEAFTHYGLRVYLILKGGA